VDAADSIDAETVFDSHDEVTYLLSLGPAAAHELVAEHERQVALLSYPRRFSGSRLRTAIKELRDEGKVSGIGYTKTPSGRVAIIWALTEETR
jgi:hypothetical protein